MRYNADIDVTDSLLHNNLLTKFIPYCEKRSVAVKPKKVLC